MLNPITAHCTHPRDERGFLAALLPNPLPFGQAGTGILRAAPGVGLQKPINKTLTDGERLERGEGNTGLCHPPGDAHQELLGVHRRAVLEHELVQMTPSLLQCLVCRVTFAELLGAKSASVGVRRGAPAAYL